MGKNQLVESVSMKPSQCGPLREPDPIMRNSDEIIIRKSHRPLLKLLSLSWKLPFRIVDVDAFHWTYGYFSFRIIEIQWIAEIFGIFAKKKILKMTKCPNRRNYLTFSHCTYKTSVRLSGISIPLRSIVEYKTSFSDDLSSKIPFFITNCY